MSFKYTYLLQDFLPQNVTLSQTRFLMDIQKTTSIDATLLNIEDTDDSVILNFDRELTPEQEATIQTLLSNHTGNDIFDTIAYVNDQKPAGVHGGTFQNRIWVERELNTVLGNNIDVWLTLQGNHIILEPGYYTIDGTFRSGRVGNNQVRLRDVTRDEIVFYGPNSSSDEARISGSFYVPNVGPEFAFEHQGRNTKIRTGLGIANNFGGPEIYSQVRVSKKM